MWLGIYGWARDCGARGPYPVFELEVGWVDHPFFKCQFQMRYTRYRLDSKPKVRVIGLLHNHNNMLFLFSSVYR